MKRFGGSGRGGENESEIELVMEGDKIKNQYEASHNPDFRDKEEVDTMRSTTAFITC